MSAPLNLTEAEVRQLVGDVKSVHLITSGGQKVVYRIEPKTGDPFVTKIIQIDDLARPDALRKKTIMSRAEREFEILRSCTCDTLAKAGPLGLDSRELNGRHLLFFSEELIPGEDLGQVLKKSGAIDPGGVRQLGKDIGNAIKELWSKQKIHRDIKPQNVMRKPDGRFVLLDSGLALDVGGDSLSGGFVVGTQLYFSPEQWEYGNRRALDFRSDLFALGLTMYQAATDRHPFFDPIRDNVASLYSNLVNRTPEPLSKGIAGFPDDLSMAVSTCLRRKPHLRYPTMDKFLAQLTGS